MKRSLSWEGIAFSEYNFGHLVFSIPLMVLLGIFWKLSSFFVKDKGSAMPKHPDRVLYVAFHRDLMYFVCGDAIWKDIVPRKVAWIGIHHWASYAGSLQLILKRARCFRYDRRRLEKPLVQIIEFLKGYEGPAFIRCDAGGPYDEVKISTLKMAIESQRDIVCFRQTATKSFYSRLLTGTHFYPLPFSEIKTEYSKIFAWQDLEKMGLEVAREKIQSEMTQLLC